MTKSCLSGRCVGGEFHAGFPVALLRVYGQQRVRHHRLGLLSGQCPRMLMECCCFGVFLFLVGFFLVFLGGGGSRLFLVVVVLLSYYWTLNLRTHQLTCCHSSTPLCVPPPPSPHPQNIQANQIQVRFCTYSCLPAKPHI